jgi:hypothetical protein
MLPELKSIRAPLLKVIPPTLDELGTDELVALRVADFATLTALEAIEPVEPIFNVPAEILVAPE